MVKVAFSFKSQRTEKNQSNAWDAWRWRKYMWLPIYDGAITLGVSLHEDMTKLISARLLNSLKY